MVKGIKGITSTKINHVKRIKIFQEAIKSYLKFPENSIKNVKRFKGIKSIKSINGNNGIW